jgi:hypothetical protein
MKRPNSRRTRFFVFVNFLTTIQAFWWEPEKFHAPLSVPLTSSKTTVWNSWIVLWMRPHLRNVKVKVKSSLSTGLDRLPKFQDNRHMKVARLSAVRIGRLNPPGDILLLISIVVSEKSQWPHRDSNPRLFGLYRSSSTNCATVYLHLKEV